MSDTIDPTGSNLGDIDDVLHNRGVADLSWLSVDIEEYNRSEAVPKQNIDIIPELQRALAEEPDSRVPSMIPVRQHVMVNRNPLDRDPPPVRSAGPSVRDRVASYVVAGLPPKAIADRIQLEYGPDQIRAASHDVQDVLRNRGLLGNVYVDASHMPGCHRDGGDKKLVAHSARRALYVLGKDECNDCVHNKAGTCASLQKRIVSSIPYDDKTLAHYTMELAAEGRLHMQDLPRTSEARREVLRLSFLSPVNVQNPDGVRKVRQQDRVARPVVTPEAVQDFVRRVNAPDPADPMPSAPYLKYSKRMMDGHDDTVLLVQSPDPEIRKLAGEHGLLGHTYIDVDAFGGCRAALASVSSSGVRPDFFIRRSASCGTCLDACDGACFSLSQIAPVVPRMPEIAREHVESAISRAATRGVMSTDAARVASSRLRDGLGWKSLASRINLMAPEVDDSPRVHANRTKTFHGATTTERPVALDPEEVRRTVSHLMNTGLRGKDLKDAILSRYSRDSLPSVKDLGKRVASLDGIQGDFFIDPTAYRDYGRGCSEGSSSFRKRGAPNLMVASGCTGCVYQTHPGWCSKYAKTLIRSVPGEVVARAASRKLPVIQMVPVRDPAVELGMTDQAPSLEVGPRTVARSVPDISLPSGRF
jgi:hypothetical protein